MPSASDIMECPADGCEYTGVSRSVLAHYSGKQDERHKGGYLTAQEKIEDAEVVGQVDGDGGDPDAAGVEDDPDGDNPIMGDGPPEPASEPASGPDRDADGEVCPDCGGELVDYRQYEDGRYHEIAGSQHYVRGDFLCAECSRWWVDE